MPTITSPYGSPVYGGAYGLTPSLNPYPGTASAPVGVSGLAVGQMSFVQLLQCTMAALSQTQQGWGTMGGSPHYSLPPATTPPVVEKSADPKEGSPYYKAMDMIHGVLDPIPIVGDIAKGICGLLNPEYHKSRNTPAPAPTATISVAANGYSSGGTSTTARANSGGVTVDDGGGAYG